MLRARIKQGRFLATLWFDGGKLPAACWQKAKTGKRPPPSWNFQSLILK
ncbi:MAG: hypothetical protein LBK00_06045 [Treponema sp.]|jgi:hypothetical protein|nr:hypothetical protein [Treponema sp.]